MFMPGDIFDYFEITGLSEVANYTGQSMKINIELTDFYKISPDYNI